MRRSEAGRGVWLASTLGLPAVNTGLIWVLGPSLALLCVLPVVELALLATRLHPRSRGEAAGLLVLVALAVAAGTTILLLLSPLVYVVIVCGIAGQPCFD